MHIRSLIAAIVAIILLSCDPVAGKTVSDQLGRKLEVPDDPKRIVSLAPSITEIIFQLNLRFDVINRCYWEIIEQSDNDFVKIRALNGQMNLTFSWIKTLERLGFIDRERIIKEQNKKEETSLDLFKKAIEWRRKELKKQEKEDV